MKKNFKLLHQHKHALAYLRPVQHIGFNTILPEYEVGCTCKWREKAQFESSARVQFEKHKTTVADHLARFFICECGESGSH